ncbi:MAG: arginine--tRNA ligase [Desulfobacteraceae bacterium]|nr:arginine--tRNA ligase [Desulfobacteraceae bacterium]
MKQFIKQLILDGARKAYDEGLLKSDNFPEMEIEAPRYDAQGDFSTNFAMVSASVQKMAPRKIAEAVLSCMNDTESVIEKTEIAGPGFINFFLTTASWHPVLETIVRKDDLYGSSGFGGGKKVQVEFVSANPTGPLHVGHARGAAVGDAMGRILAFAGFDVQKEYYINDSGRQIRTLGLSVWLRLCQELGREVDFPQDCYQGDYIKDIARELHEKMGADLTEKEEAEAVVICAKYAASVILEGIKEDLAGFGVEYDQWFSEQSLYDSNRVQKAIEDFKAKDLIYEKDGALWFRTSDFGDEKDRVVVRNNGLTTYFASDIAYHMEKFDRGFDRVIDVWGADHHGYINRINASIDASGKSSDQFDVILVQLVNLLRGGQPVAMSSRSGEFVTLKDIVDEVGKDAARFLFLSRSYDSGLDFDLEVAKQKTSENPVYYVQYVHARIAGIVAKAVAEEILDNGEQDWAGCAAMLVEPEEVRLIKILASFPEIVEKSAATLHPHVVFTYLMELASAFHGYYNKHKVITQDRELSRGRLFLVTAVKKVIRNGLSLLGVSAPERM